MPPGAPRVTPQSDRPLIQISPRSETGDFNLLFQMNWPTLNVEGLQGRRYVMCFSGGVF